MDDTDATDQAESIITRAYRAYEVERAVRRKVLLDAMALWIFGGMAAEIMGLWHKPWWLFMAELGMIWRTRRWV